MSVVGIDIGGSKTHGLLVDGEQVLAEAIAGSANISSVGPAEALRQLRIVAADLAAAGPIDLVCVGGAGVDSPAAEVRLRRLVEEAFPGAPVHVVHDTQLVLAAAGLSEGIVLISGTGSVAWGRTAAGAQARAGGWGYLLGDDGSAYGVVRAAIRHCLHTCDEGGAPDPLSLAILQSAGVDDAGGLLDASYREPSRREWAARAGLVVALAEAGDPAAVAVVDAAVAELAQTVTRVRRRLGIAGPVVLAGGLLVHQPLVQRGVRAALDHDGAAPIRVLERDPVHGAVALAHQTLAHPASPLAPECDVVHVSEASSGGLTSTTSHSGEAAGGQRGLET
jgi:glucosamine kinase